MDAYEKVVCDLFHVPDQGYIAKPRLIKALAMLNVDYESIHIDLYGENPNHKRFEKFTALDRDRMQKMVDARRKREEPVPVLAPEEKKEEQHAAAPVC